MKNIALQLGEALNLLSDYPGIQDILDIPHAQQFLKQLGDIPAAAGVPSFSEVDQTKLTQIREGFAGTLEGWREALNSLPQVTVIDEESNSEGELICGHVPANLQETQDTWTEGDTGYFSFCVDNQAELSTKDGLVKGTWAEVYAALVKHVNEKFDYPDVPE